MFDVEVNESSPPTIKLLSNIQGLLLDLRQALIPSSAEVTNTENIDSMGRKELLEIIKALPQNAIKGKYMTMKIEKLRNAVKEALTNVS